MIPTPLLLVWRYRKPAGYALAAVAVAGLLWRVGAWRSGYLERNTAVASLEALQSDLARANAAVIASESAYAASRRATADAMLLANALANRPPPDPKTLIIERPTHAPVTSCPDRSPEWVREYNSAVTAAGYP